MPEHGSGGTTALRGRVVTPEAEIADGLVLVDRDGIITWVGPAAGAPRSAARAAGSPNGVDLAAPPATLLPGLVDLHCHGGGGVGFPDVTDAAGARVAAGEHLAHGTTSLVASLVTAPADVLLARTAVLAELAATGELAGIHVEGPFLSPARCGAQDARQMVPGDAELVRSLARAARGNLTTMTVAPEVPGVLGRGGVVTALVAAGAVPSVGHTDASAELTFDALETIRRALTGARSSRPTVTHLFNGMRPLHHRDPGPVAACLAAAARGSAVLELVADGVHLAAATVRSVFDLVGASAIALVTDAMAAAGMPDGRYTLGGADVQVADGAARLHPVGALAGGTAHLIDVVRTTVAAGVPLVDAVRAASLTPAGVLGRSDIGALEVGRRADVLVVDDDLVVRRVLRGGRTVGGAA